MKALIIIALLTFLSCDITEITEQENKQPTWTALTGECLSNEFGVGGANTCKFIMGNNTKSLTDLKFQFSFSYLTLNSSFVEFRFLSDSSLSRGIVLSMEKNQNTISFSLSDLQGNYHEVKINDEHTDLEDVLEYQVEFLENKTNNTKKIILSKVGGSEIFNTDNDLANGALNINNFKTSGDRYGFKVRNAYVRSILEK